MKRRSFLRRAGLAAMGVPADLANAGGAPAPPGAEGRGKSLLITSAHSRFALALGVSLRSKYRVSMTSPADIGTAPLDFIQCPLDRSEATRALVRGVDGIVHVGEAPAGAGEEERIDYRTRLTYNLLRAAVDEGVGAVVYLSSLDIVVGHGASFAVDEDWEARPPAEAGTLSDYLGEFICREFARAGELRVSVLRLGKIVRASEVTGRRDQLWVDEQDVIQAVSLALAALLATPKPRLGPWSVFHILSASLEARFSVDKARRILGYRPQWKG